MDLDRCLSPLHLLQRPLPLSFTVNQPWSIYLMQNNFLPHLQFDLKMAFMSDVHFCPCLSGPSTSMRHVALILDQSKVSRRFPTRLRWNLILIVTLFQISVCKAPGCLSDPHTELRVNFHHIVLHLQCFIYTRGILQASTVLPYLHIQTSHLPQRHQGPACTKNRDKKLVRLFEFLSSSSAFFLHPLEGFCHILCNTVRAFEDKLSTFILQLSALAAEPQREYGTGKNFFDIRFLFFFLRRLKCHEVSSEVFCIFRDLGLLKLL